MSTTKILKALQISYLFYDNFREKCFQEWARKYSREFGISLRALVTHDGLRNWYHDQWQIMVEKPFVKENYEFFHMNAASALQDLVLTYPDKINNHYPAPILKMIKQESNELNKRHITVQ